MNRLTILKVFVLDNIAVRSTWTFVSTHGDFYAPGKTLAISSIIKPTCQRLDGTAINGVFSVLFARSVRRSVSLRLELPFRGTGTF